MSQPKTGPAQKVMAITNRGCGRPQPGFSTDDDPKSSNKNRTDNRKIKTMQPETKTEPTTNRTINSKPDVQQQIAPTTAIAPNRMSGKNIVESQTRSKIGFPTVGNHHTPATPTAEKTTWGDPRLCVCQAPNAFICVSPWGSILGPFQGPFLGPFRVHCPFFGSNIDASFRVSTSV